MNRQRVEVMELKRGDRFKYIPPDRPEYMIVIESFSVVFMGQPKWCVTYVNQVVRAPAFGLLYEDPHQAVNVIKATHRMKMPQMCGNVENNV